MSTYDIIKMLCKKKSISVSFLEKELGLSNASISKWGKSAPGAESIKKVADYFGVTMEYIMTGEEKEDSPIYYTNEETAEVAQKLFEDDKVLFDIYRSSDKDRLVAYAKKLKALRDMEEGDV